MDSAAADLELLIGVGGGGWRRIRSCGGAGSRREGRPARELRTAAGKDAGDADGGGARRRILAEGRCDGGRRLLINFKSGVFPYFHAISSGRNETPNNK